MNVHGGIIITLRLNYKVKITTSTPICLLVLHSLSICINYTAQILHYYNYRMLLTLRLTVMFAALMKKHFPSLLRELFCLNNKTKGHITVPGRSVGWWENYLFSQCQHFHHLVTDFTACNQTVINAKQQSVLIHTLMV